MLYLLRSWAIRQVVVARIGFSMKPAKGPRKGIRPARSSSNTSKIVRSLNWGCLSAWRRRRIGRPARRSAPRASSPLASGGTARHASCRPGSRPGPSPSRTPACRRRVRPDDASKLQEAPVIGARPADEDRLHRGLHIVVDAAPADPAIEGEGPVVRVNTISCVSRDRRARTACG